VPTLDLSSDISLVNRAIAVLDDAPLGWHAAMIDDPEPDETQRGYQALAAAVIALAVNDVAKVARKDLDSALRHVGQLARSPWWQVWCDVLGLEASALSARLAVRLKQGDVAHVSLYKSEE
jgi:hypothetical protein